MAPLTNHYARKPQMTVESSKGSTTTTTSTTRNSNLNSSSRHNNRDAFLAAFASRISLSERLLVAAAKEHNQASSPQKNQAVAVNEEPSSPIDEKTVEAFVLDAGYSSLAEYTSQLYQNEDDYQFLDGLIMFVDPQQLPIQQDKKKKLARKNTERKVSRAA